MKILETFSGIGSQAKALKNVKIKYELFANVDWDINAIIAYDLIHNGEQDTSIFDSFTKEELEEKLSHYTFSIDGKSPYTKVQLKHLNRETLKRVLSAIKRCNNLVSITDIKGKDIPNDIDIFTYSFPCQDLSVAGSWHGNTSGIDRNVDNRSGMLWEVERILKEMDSLNKTLPKFLLMENVSNIQSERHKDNFEEWINFLKGKGYTNRIYCLNAKDFGIPQNRERLFMISVRTDFNSEKEKVVDDYFNKNNLENKEYVKTIVKNKIFLGDVLKLDYSVEKYRKEADECQPNYTPSRKKIFFDNEHIFDGKKISAKIIKTITTKQDRNPNSGVIVYDNKNGTKAPYRTLTPRECFLLMGFSEEDFNILLENNFLARKNTYFFTSSKLFKLAGNSIVVKILEYIFKQIKFIDENIL